MSASDPRDRAIFATRIYVRLHIAMQHTEYTCRNLCTSGFREKGTSRQRSGKGAIRKRTPLHKLRWENNIFHNCISDNTPMVHDDALGAGTVWAPAARLAGFIKRITKHCFKQNMKALDHVVSEKKICILCL